MILRLTRIGYHDIRKECTSFYNSGMKYPTTLPLLYRVIKPDKIVIVVLDSLFYRVEDSSIVYDDILDFVKKDTLEYVHRVVGVELLDRIKVLVLPAVGNYDNTRIKSKEGDIVSLEFHNRSLREFSVFLEYLLVRELEDVIGQDRLELHVDLIHGINFLPALTLDVVKNVTNILAMFTSLNVITYNADPYMEGKDLEIHTPILYNVVSDFTLHSILTYKPLRTLGVDWDYTEFAKYLNGVLGALSGGYPLALLHFLDKLMKHLNVNNLNGVVQILSEILSKVYNKYIESQKVIVQGDDTYVVRVVFQDSSKINFEVFRRLVGAYLVLKSLCAEGKIQKYLDYYGYGFIKIRDLERMIQEIKVFSKRRQLKSLLSERGLGELIRDLEDPRSRIVLNLVYAKRKLRDLNGKPLVEVCSGGQRTFKKDNFWAHLGFERNITYLKIVAENHLKEAVNKPYNHVIKEYKQADIPRKLRECIGLCYKLVNLEDEVLDALRRHLK